jgi:hypothetical protein
MSHIEDQLLNSLDQGVAQVHLTPPAPQGAPHFVIRSLPTIHFKHSSIPEIVTAACEIPHLTVIWQDCTCGGEDSSWVSPLCGGTKGCGRKSLSDSRCGCNGTCCKRSVRGCCHGTHQDGEGSQTYNSI